MPKWISAFVSIGVAVVLGVVVVVAVRGAKGGANDAMSASPRSAQSPKQLWHCGMHPQVIREKPGDCPICHMPLTPMKSTESRNSAANAAAGQHLWWDPMLGPSSVSDHPGKSAMGMEMVPYTGHTAQGSEVTIDPAIVQNMGVQTAAVTRGPLHQTIRGVGVFKLPEPGLHDISLKVGGWIDKLYADQEGMHVHQGEPLFALYSPDLQVAAQELISAAQSQRSLGSDTSENLRKESQNMVDSARRKLQLWDVDEREIDAIAKADRPPRDVVFYSPATGHVEDKMIVQGSAIQPGMKLMRVADHSKMWLDAQVYENQIPLVQMGQTVEATLDALPGKTFTGQVTFIYPHVEHTTRTLMVRATFDNPNFELKPGMYADANVMTMPVADALQVPQEAMIDTGTKQIVFIARGNGHFGPRTVRAGVRGDDDRLQIMDGLTVGETVVTSGQFLMDVESRTNEAIAKLRGGPEAAAASDALTPTEPAPPASGPAVMNGMAMPMEAPAASKDLSVMHCPMAKADWIQVSGDTANPYMAADMRDCGSVTASVHAPAPDSPLAKVVAAYLSFQKALATDRVDPAAIGQLKAAAGQINGDPYKTLRDATDKLVSIKELAAARQQSKAVSNALIALMNPPKEH